MCLTDHRTAEARLLAELTAERSIALCMACLMAATGLSAVHGSAEAESHGRKEETWDAHCDRCRRPAVIIAIAES